MDPHEELSHTCRRYGVPLEFGRRLLPLIERARTAPPETRQRILRLVESSFEKEACRLALGRRPASSLEERSLRCVARVLHGWSLPDVEPGGSDRS